MDRGLGIVAVLETIAEEDEQRLARRRQELADERETLARTRQERDAEWQRLRLQEDAQREQERRKQDASEQENRQQEDDILAEKEEALRKEMVARARRKGLEALEEMCSASDLPGSGDMEDAANALLFLGRALWQRMTEGSMPIGQFATLAHGLNRLREQIESA